MSNSRIAWGSFVRPSEDWGKLLGDVPSATAILDRFLHHATIIAITGRSYRLRNQARIEPETAAVEDADNSKPAISPAGSTAAGKRKKSPAQPTETCQS